MKATFIARGKVGVMSATSRSALPDMQRRDQPVPVKVQEGDLDAHFLRHQLGELDGAAGALAGGVDQREGRPLRLHGDAQFAARDDVVERSGAGSAGEAEQGKACDEKIWQSSLWYSSLLRYLFSCSPRAF